MKLNASPHSFKFRRDCFSYVYLASVLKLLTHIHLYITRIHKSLDCSEYTASVVLSF